MEIEISQLPYYSYNNEYDYNVFLHKAFLNLYNLLTIIKNQSIQSCRIQNTFTTFPSLKKSQEQMLYLYQLYYSKTSQANELIQKELQPLIMFSLSELSLEQKLQIYNDLTGFANVMKEVKETLIPMTILCDSLDLVREVQSYIEKIIVKLSLISSHIKDVYNL